MKYIWLLPIIIIAMLLQLSLLGDNILHGIPLTNTLDFSWQTDSVERLLHGFLAGRDFIFTYGPLFQIIYATPAFLFGQPSYISILFAPILLVIFNIFILYLITNSVMNDSKKTVFVTIFFVFIIDLLAYDQNMLFRILLPFFLWTTALPFLFS